MTTNRTTCNGGYRVMRVKGCTCGWGYPHEPGCGTDIDDRTEPRHLAATTERGRDDAA